MTKRRRTILVVATVLLLSVVVYSAVTVFFPTRRLALTAFHGPRGNAVFGLPLVEPTFENHVIWLSSNIIIGTILPTPPERASVGFYDVRVEEKILSRTEGNTIKVSAGNHLFEVGETYLMLLSRFAVTEYPFDFYVADLEFTFRVDAPKDQVQRLVRVSENPEERVFIAPFQEPQYNSLARLREYIRSLAPANHVRSFRFQRNRDARVIEEAPSQAALISMADHILLIEITSARLNRNQMIAEVKFKTLNEFKGQEKYDKTGLLLPAGVEINQRYLVFLIESGEEAGHLTLATRRGSVVAETDPEFSALLEELTASRR
ncbi:MAG: hypothetical protein KGZ66_08960 [Selenomonadales bacterium]|nr:hypothetical protein [Selenomonadales bacterium]